MLGALLVQRQAVRRIAQAIVHSDTAKLSSNSTFRGGCRNLKSTVRPHSKLSQSGSFVQRGGVKVLVRKSSPIQRRYPSGTATRFYSSKNNSSSVPQKGNSKSDASSSIGAGASVGKGSSRTRPRRRKPRSRRSGGNGATWAAMAGVSCLGVGTAYYMGLFGSEADSNSASSGAAVDGKGYNPAKEGAGTFAGFVHKVMDHFGSDSGDVDGKLLPDYENSVFYQEGAPPPLTLVVDLEETLGTSTWDRKHGWRFVKRPGLDQFLHHMARCGFEVVIFSTNPSVGAVEDTLALLDPMGQLAPYKLYCNSAKFQDERYVKDFSNLNRDSSRFIVIDDNIDDLVNYQENCIAVKPFDDINIVDDDTLPNLAIYLQSLAQAFSQGSVKDVRAELRRFQPKSRTAKDSDADGDGAELDFLGNFSVFRKRQLAAKKKARERGLGARLRKTKLLQAKQQQTAQGSAKQHTTGFSQTHLGNLGSLAGPGAPMGQMSAAQVIPASGIKYRKTIWERMTDPDAAAKQDKEIQEKEKLWKKHLAANGRP